MRDVVKNNNKKITIVSPVFNDWPCVQYLIRDISNEFENKADIINFLAINDCSTESPTAELDIPNNINFKQINLITNVGHQRAILIGLCYTLEERLDSDYIIVIDSDGEDNPKYIHDFLEKMESSNQNEVVFAKRSKRSEGWSFRLFYTLYKILFKLLTGSSISFGNFSCIPKPLLSKICNEPNCWNHYSASIMNSKIPYATISSKRRKRYIGNSKMNFNSLIVHGLSSLSVYIQPIIIRILKLSFIILLLLVCASLVVLYVKLFTHFAIPGWATFVFGFIFNLLLMVGAFNLLMILSHLNNRNKPIYRPLNFYKTLIEQ